MKQIPIIPHSLRYRIAQLLLRVLFKRPTHYISPWQHAGVSVNVFVMYNNKVLLSKRCGNIENAGKLGLLGGFVDFEHQENERIAAKREIYEEANWQLTEEEYNKLTYIDHYFYHGAQLIEMHNVSGVLFAYKLVMDENPLNKVHNTEEAQNYALYSFDEVQKLHQEHKLHISLSWDIIKKAFNKD